MKFYVGVDLHSNNCYIGVVDEEGKKVFQHKYPNNLGTIINGLIPFKEYIQGVVIESTFNWYWLVDGLSEAGFKIHLANTTAIQQYSGLKYSDDTSDAFWLANMLRLKILPEGYIYPKETRSIRDLLRKRMVLVNHRTALMLSIKGMISNCTGQKISRSKLQNINNEYISEIFEDLHATLSAQSMNDVIKTLTDQIKNIEKVILKELKMKREFTKLLTVNGIGKILGLTIMLETGDITRFSKVGNYTSFCRCVPSVKLSNGKNKGSGNKKSGNRFLAWAYVEAAHHMVLKSQAARKWHQKKIKKGGYVLATKALSSKIARACYYIMKDGVAYNPKKIFS